jgi:hypothetical protein
MTRFRPTVEVLDARALPSAVFASPDALTSSAAPAEAVQLAGTSADVADQDDSLATTARKTGAQQEHLTIRMTDILVSSYS